MKLINNIKEKWELSLIKKNLDYEKEIKLLRKKFEEEVGKNKPLIDLKNVYLSNYRVKCLEIARLKKKLEKIDKYMQECEAGNILFTGLNYREVKDIIGGK